MAEMKKLWDNYRVIGEVQKSDRIKFVIGAGIRDGVRYINIREFYFTVRAGEWKPGRDGITVPLAIPVDKGARVVDTYAQFASLLEGASYTLLNMPLSDPANAVYIEKKEKK